MTEKRDTRATYDAYLKGQASLRDLEAAAERTLAKYREGQSLPDSDADVRPPPETPPASARSRQPQR